MTGGRPESRPVSSPVAASQTRAGPSSEAASSSAGRWRTANEAPPIWTIDILAEQKIEEAIARGEFDNLPGAGRPLPDEDLSLVPEHLRAGYRLLKNAGYLPPELHGLGQLRRAEDLIRRIDDPALRGQAQKRLRLLELRLRESRGYGLDSRLLVEFEARLLALTAVD